MLNVRRLRAPRFWLISALVGYFMIQITLRPILSSSLELDEAELMLLTQRLDWGYTAQPPLYTWLQIAVFELTGRHIFGLAILKNLLLFLTYYFNYLSTKRVFRGDFRRLVIVTLSFFLIRQIAWEAQRDLSHTVLALMLASASLYWILRGIEQRSTYWYLMYGFLMGLGVLSKYNFGLFIISANITLLTLPAGRDVLGHWRIILSLTIFFLVIFPHGLWFADHTDIALSSQHKLQMSGNSGRWSGIASLALASLDFVTPLWLVYVAVFRRQFLWTGFGDTVSQSYVQRYLLATVTVLISGILLFGVSHISDRWLTPLLFALPAAVCCKLPTIQRREFLWFAGISSTMAIAILVAFVIRATLWPAYITPTRHQFPFEGFAEKLRQENMAAPTIIGDSAFIAGNLIYWLPKSVAYTPGIEFPHPRKTDTAEKLLIAWDAEKQKQMPNKLSELLRDTLRFNTEKLKPTYISIPYYKSTKKIATLGFVLITETNNGNAKY